MYLKRSYLLLKSQKICTVGHFLKKVANFTPFPLIQPHPKIVTKILKSTSKSQQKLPSRRSSSIAVCWHCNILIAVPHSASKKKLDKPKENNKQPKIIFEKMIFDFFKNLKNKKKEKKTNLKEFFILLFYYFVCYFFIKNYC